MAILGFAVGNFIYLLIRINSIGGSSSSSSSSFGSGFDFGDFGSDGD